MFIIALEEGITKTSQELLSKHENLIEELKIAYKYKLSRKIINGLYAELRQLYKEVYARKNPDI